MIICGIDGGKPPKLVLAYRAGPGYWVGGDPQVPVCFDLAAAEKPEGVIRAKRTPASIISPAGWGMAALFAVDAEKRVWVPTDVWKEKLFPGRSKVKKEVFCAQIAQRFRLVGLDPKDENDQDTIDAIGICEAAALLTQREIKKYAVAFKVSARYILASDRP